MASPSGRERDDLYVLPPAEFTRARNELVARLRIRGKPAEARDVARLRKPTAVVSAINRVARNADDDVETLITSVDRLRRAHTRAPADLPEAMSAHRAGLARLVERITHELDTRSPELTRRISGTLLAAAMDGNARPDLRKGRLTRELEPPGFEALAGERFGHLRVVTSSTKAKAEARPRQRDPGDARRRAAEAAARRSAARQAATALNRAKTLEAQAATHERIAAKSAHTAAQLRSKLQQLEERAGRAREAASEASREAARLRKR